MVKHPLSSRIIVDYDFFNDFLRTRYMVAWDMMHINNGSKLHHKSNNVISKQIFEKLLRENPDMAKQWVFKAAIERVEEPAEIEKESDEITRNLKYASYFSNYQPFKVHILTVDGKKKTYEESEHYKDTKDVVILSGEEAVRFINFLGEEVRASRFG